LTSTDVTGRTAAYSYDAASRLTSETITADPRGAGFNGALTYVVDGAGNRLSRTSTLVALGAQSFTYNANDEVSTDTYDANGNTLTSDGHTYAYDFEDRLISKDGGAVTITYDCDGNRVAKTVGGVTTRYLVEDLNPTGYLQVLEEIVAGTTETRYTYGTNVVSQTRAISTMPATNYYGYDAHGNVTFLTDASGAVTDSYDYDAWGLIAARTGGTTNSRLYVGEDFDAELGLINLRARQYKASTGRFLTLDPLPGVAKEPASFNKYNYAQSDAVNRVDPSGTIAVLNETYQMQTMLTFVAKANTLLLFGLGTLKYPARATGSKSLTAISETALSFAGLTALLLRGGQGPIAGIVSAFGVGAVAGCMLSSAFWPGMSPAAGPCVDWNWFPDLPS
jgi:RHS repeat-associated protein